MNEHALREELIELALAAEPHCLTKLRGDFHAAPPQRRGEMAAWIVHCLSRRAEQGDRAVLDFWEDRRGRPRLPQAGAKPRVGLLSPGLRMGGAEHWVIDLARHLDRGRLNLVGVAIQNQHHVNPMVSRAVDIAPVILGQEGAAYLARQADVLITWGIKDLPLGAPRDTIYVSHGASACARHWGPLIAAKRIKLAAVSQWAAKIFPPGSGVTVIHNGVDTGRLVAHQSREMVRREWGLADDEIAIGHVGRISHEKNPAAAAMAAATLGKPYRAVYVGADPQLGRSNRQVVQFLKRLNPHAESVVLPPTEHVGDIYGALDCFVLASPLEGFSRSLTEAWCCGVPTVATPVGAVPEPENRFGPMTVRVPVDPTPDDLAQAVRQALAPENHPVVQRAQAVARKHFSAEAMGKRWTDYVLELAATDKDV